ncbi:hypothetical protein D3C87_1805740 [compost metagenome]
MHESFTVLRIKTSSSGVFISRRELVILENKFVESSFAFVIPALDLNDFSNTYKLSGWSLSFASVGNSS